MFAKFVAYLKAIAMRRRAEQELDEELQFHVEMESGEAPDDGRQFIGATGFDTCSWNPAPSALIRSHLLTDGPCRKRDRECRPRPSPSRGDERRNAIAHARRASQCLYT